MDSETTTCEMTPLCLVNPYEKLANILESIDNGNKDLNFCTFETTLEKANLDDLDEPVETHKNQTLLQLACANKEATRYVKLLVTNGANPNGSGYRTPLYLASYYGCLNTLEYLTNLRIVRDDAFFHKDQLGNNLLHILHDDCARMLPRLIQKGVDVNHTNRRGETPIHYQLKNNRLKVVETLLKYIDSLPNDNTWMNLSIDTKLKTRELLLVKLHDRDNLIEIVKRIPVKEPPKDLFQILYRGDQVEFEKRIETEDVNQSDGCYTLLQIAVSNGYTWAVTKLLQRGADHNATSKINVPPLHIAASRGYYEIIEILLNARRDSIWTGIEDNSTTPLHYLLKNWSRVENKEQCLNLLLEIPGLDINAREPVVCNTALHYATKLKAHYATTELLKRGAYIGSRNKLKETPLSSIDPDTFEEFLNSCIDDNEMNPVEDSYQVCINYNFLFHPCSHEAEMFKTTKIKDAENPYLISSSAPPTMKEHLESDPLVTISRTRGLRHFLQHPVFSAFLYLKWQRIQIFYYINLLYYSLFVIMACIYAVCYYGDAPINHHNHREDGDNENYAIKHCLMSGYAILLLILAVRELFQMLVSTRHYFSSPENYLELGIINLSWIILCCPISSPIIRRHLAAVMILFCGVELVLLIGRHPFLSTYIEMFKKVSWNFIKFLIWYFILIISFALSFYILFREAPTSQCEIFESENGTSAETAAAEDDKDQFASVGQSMFKTIVMLTGEFDASDIPFGCLRWPSYVMFTIFVFLISIVLVNLLNGLAVNDTTSIQQDAVLVSLTARVELIHYFERVLDQFISRLCCLSDDNGIGHRIRHRLNLQDLIPTGRIAILVNKNSRLVLDLTKDNLEKINHPSDVSLTGCYTCDSRSCCQQHLEKQILTDAQTIIKQKQQISLEQLYTQMDTKVKALSSRLDENQKTLIEILNLVKNQQINAPMNNG